MKKILITCILIASCFYSSYGIRPEKKYSVTPATYGLPYESKYLAVNDTIKIIAWHIPSVSEQEKNTSIVISSGECR